MVCSLALVLSRPANHNSNDIRHVRGERYGRGVASRDRMLVANK